jgi:hypothetical protein
MKQILTIVSIFISLFLCGQKSVYNPSKLVTVKYAGTYSFGKDIEKGRIGYISVFPETDSTIRFYVEANRGAPSYGMGSLYGRVKMINGQGTFYNKLDSTDKGYKFTFSFSKRMLTLRTIDGYEDCGFGFGVYVDGDYKQYSNKIPVRFVDLEGHNIPFKTTSPEDYNKDH